ncbi:MAG: hypothetical protein MUO54_02260 [Anaerolineales bacterium]|nr:hypothetical protein [Anaerolineales bacterium]
MDNSFDQLSIETQLKPTLLSSLLQIYHNIKGWLVASFVLTEEEKIDAGIYIGRVGEGE